MTATTLLWTILGVAIVGGGAFFGVLRHRFHQKHGNSESPAPPHEQRAVRG